MAWERVLLESNKAANHRNPQQRLVEYFQECLIEISQEDIRAIPTHTNKVFHILPHHYLRQQGNEKQKPALHLCLLYLYPFSVLIKMENSDIASNYNLLVTMVK